MTSAVAAQFGLPSSRVPWSQTMTGKNTLTPRLMEVSDHLPNGRKYHPACPDQVVLISIVDANVGIGMPDENGVYSAVSLFTVSSTYRSTVYLPATGS